MATTPVPPITQSTPDATPPNPNNGVYIIIGTVLLTAFFSGVLYVVKLSIDKLATSAPPELIEALKISVPPEIVTQITAQAVEVMQQTMLSLQQQSQQTLNPYDDAIAQMGKQIVDGVADLIKNDGRVVVGTTEVFTELTGEGNDPFLGGNSPLG